MLASIGVGRQPGIAPVRHALVPGRCVNALTGHGILEVEKTSSLPVTRTTLQVSGLHAYGNADGMVPATALQAEVRDAGRSWGRGDAPQEIDGIEAKKLGMGLALSFVFAQKKAQREKRERRELGAPFATFYSE